jgi:hypothetical protein
MSALAAAEPQRLAALRKANRVRLARATLKHRVADGTTTVGDVLLTCPPEATTMPIGELLRSQRRWGSLR